MISFSKLKRYRLWHFVNFET